MRRGGVAGSVARAINSITGSGSSNYVAPSTGDVVFLTGNLHAGIVDETILDAAVVPDGIYQYTTTLGATKTVTKYKVLKMKAD